MANVEAILVNLDRCVECRACEIACKMENGLKHGEKWITLIAIGPEEVGDNLYAEYYPIISEQCSFCRHRVAEGLEPFCVAVCPTKALVFSESAQILAALRSSKRYQICGIAEAEA